jgi:hypothetical protein
VARRPPLERYVADPTSGRKNDADLAKLVNSLLEAPMFRRILASPNVEGIEYLDEKLRTWNIQLQARMSHKMIGAVPVCGLTVYLSMTGASAQTTFTLGTIHAKEDGSVTGLSAEATVTFGDVTLSVQRSTNDGANWATLDADCKLVLTGLKGGEVLFEKDRFKFQKGDLLRLIAIKASMSGGSAGSMSAEIDVEYE